MKTAILKHPLTIMVGVIIGVVLGFYNKPISETLGIDNFAEFISFPGQLYFQFLQMVIVPIVVTAISSSLGKLMRNRSNVRLIKKMVMVFVICIVITAAIGILGGILFKPGAGLIISLENGNSSEGIIFTNMIAIVFSSIIFGIAIGFLPEDSAILLINLCTALFQVFQKVINWSLFLLPFGLICFLTGQVASVGINVFSAMSKYIILYIIGTAFFFVVCTAVIWYRSGIRNPLKVVSMSFEPIFLSFVTGNSMAALPSSIKCLCEKFNFNSNSVNLALPLGLTLGRFGNIFYFALGVFFEPIHYLTIIFIAIDPIIEPFRTVLNMNVNMAATSLIAERGNKREIMDVDLDIQEAENKIQRSVRAKIAGEATEEDERIFNETNKAIERLRQEKRQLIINAQK